MAKLLDTMYINKNGQLTCRCGNTPLADGFSPCNSKGTRSQPTTNVSDYYICDRCGIVYKYR